MPLSQDEMGKEKERKGKDRRGERGSELEHSLVPIHDTVMRVYTHAYFMHVCVSLSLCVLW